MKKRVLYIFLTFNLFFISLPKYFFAQIAEQNIENRWKVEDIPYPEQFNANNSVSNSDSILTIRVNAEAEMLYNPTYKAASIQNNSESFHPLVYVYVQNVIM